MPDGLYERDILAWSERQAALLARLAAGERVNEEVDWPNVIEELESVGRSELRACESLLEQVLVHLIKLHLEPDSPAVPHWRGEGLAFAARARRAFAPSMRQRIDLPGVYTEILEAITARTAAAVRVPEVCPYELDELLDAKPDLAAILARLG